MLEDENATTKSHSYFKLGNEEVIPELNEMLTQTHLSYCGFPVEPTYSPNAA